MVGAACVRVVRLSVTLVLMKGLGRVRDLLTGRGEETMSNVLQVKTRLKKASNGIA